MTVVELIKELAGIAANGYSDYVVELRVTPSAPTGVEHIVVNLTDKQATIIGEVV